MQQVLATRLKGQHLQGIQMLLHCSGREESSIILNSIPHMLVFPRFDL